MYATIKIQMGQYAEAIAVLENVIRDDFSFWNAYYNLGVIYFRQEKYQEALQMFWRAFTLHKAWKSLEWVLISFLVLYNNYAVVALVFCVMFPIVNKSLWGIPFSVLAGLYYWFWGTYRIKVGDLWYGSFNLSFGTLIRIIHSYIYWNGIT